MSTSNSRPPAFAVHKIENGWLAVPLPRQQGEFVDYNSAIYAKNQRQLADAIARILVTKALES